MESRICLIRHGITEGNKNKLYYGFADIPLAEEGIYQLKELAAAGIYPEGDGADFYTSGLKRTEQTLELIYGQRKHETLESLREINFGDYEMKSHGELKDSEEYRIWRSDVMGSLAPPNGESLMAFYKRVVRGFEEQACRENAGDETQGSGCPFHNGVPRRHHICHTGEHIPAAEG